ncbi:cob(I)yrinic acid a,c-diamide adenosyltransferase [Clostridium malenominatum]|uniref:Corrinoid adenosyltransferase n=1 Tax=Clostridium malenominatum TaxID=1539 RepID=A0ABP3U3Z7_9CLOT
MGNIYTQKGDRGETGLFGGSKIWKDDLRVQCYGSIDETNSNIGLAYSLIKDHDMRSILNHIQKKLFILGAELASDDKGLALLSDRIMEKDVAYLEEVIDKYQRELGEQKGFIVPGSTTASAMLHVARTVARRTERNLVNLNKKEKVTDSIMKFMNRLSDALFIIARAEEENSLVREVKNRVLEKLQEGSRNSIITLEIAKEMAKMAEKRANELRLPVVVSVVDMGGNLMLMHRMDNSLLGSIDISINKAYTAVALKTSTDKLASLASSGGSLHGIQNTNDNRIVTFGGGYPIECNGEVVGGIGISGGTVEQDMDIALYSLQGFYK